MITTQRTIVDNGIYITKYLQKHLGKVLWFKILWCKLLVFCSLLLRFYLKAFKILVCLDCTFIALNAKSKDFLKNPSRKQQIVFERKEANVSLNNTTHSSLTSVRNNKNKGSFIDCIVYAYNVTYIKLDTRYIYIYIC